MERDLFVLMEILFDTLNDSRIIKTKPCKALITLNMKLKADDGDHLRIQRNIEELWVN